MPNSSHDVVIIGGGTAGITVAASLRRRAGRDLTIAIVEPAEHHYYQPAFTLVGAGAYRLSDTRRSVASLVPAGVDLITGAAKAFHPDDNAVELENGDRVSYGHLVVCPGLVLNWDKVEGLTGALGKGGVCSNYAPDQVEYTWQCIQGLGAGSKIVCTQPPMPFKCPGAPQKIAYLTADHLRKKGILGDCDVQFHTATPGIFGVPYYARALTKVAANYGITVGLSHNLVAVDGAAKKATFEVVDGDDKGQKIELDYDMLHVTPPQGPPGFIADSPLANEGGWVDVDANTMQSTKYPNIFSLGDVCSTANSKTAAAVRKQAPVVVRNILNARKGAAMEAGYDGYASCPLTTAYGKAIIAEFIYGGKVTPSFPWDPAVERWTGWWIKKTGLPIMYWRYMLKGREWFPKHNTNWKGDEA